ncbi:oxidative stress-induced growth inhibitor 1-like [Macrosteles quadrilineatus]|uniref:oxidative stress-induced growth inhibitor 1-like n=1 Tax=Macrosteles quadrilineatus TaxID=74068 RepID=UPI0023E1A790|nr:oxidative stress-induced growth inhibitor 1-like [Macrosteles quadrilineatus]
MRDLNCNSACDAVYKEVVVIGNGPSALGLSYMLAGHLPYYNGLPHPTDDMLTARLQAISTTRPLFTQDLEFLSQGLEGRSTNPVSVLMDHLTHPAADLGLDTPPLVEWRPHPDSAVDHIVLGKGPPGGAWQAMDGNVLTISLSSWMELPGLEFRKWEMLHNGGTSTTVRRVPVASVAAYYRDYVRLMRLGKYLRNNVVVTSVRRLPPLNLKKDCSCASAQWSVEGYDTETHKPFSYVCRSVVMATGSTDQPNRLCVPGEMDNTSWVFHDLAAFEKALAQFVKDNPGIKDGSRSVDPVCVVGAGLSAADAVLACRFHSVPLIHVFRRSGISPEHALPENMYPEYHKVREMMNAGGRGYAGYEAYPHHRVTHIASDSHKVSISSPSGHQSVLQASLMVILIGSRPDLSFLPAEFHDGQTLAVDPEQPLDCRSNPLAVDPWTHKVLGVGEGVYAAGPLVGDNFVRFLLGGATAITGDLHRRRKQTT